MSIEDNPFKRNDDAMYQQPTRGSSSKKPLLIGCGIFAFLGLLICCGGIAYLVKTGPQWFSSIISSTLAPQIQSQVAADPNVQQRIGEIKSLEFDVNRYAENVQAASQSGSEPQFPFRVEGDLGSGMILVTIDQNPSAPGGVGIRSGRLVMDDGTEYPLDVGAIKAGAPGNLQINMDDLFDDGEVVSPDAGQGDLGPIRLNLEGDVPTATP